MTVSYDIFTEMFLDKITEYDFMQMDIADRTDIVDGYMRRALAGFRKNCLYDFYTAGNNETREFSFDLSEKESAALEDDITEIADIVSEGMIVQWLKPYKNRQENMENFISTRDISVHSPAELLMRIGNAYNDAQKEFIDKIREYSYNHGDLTSLHI